MVLHLSPVMLRTVLEQSPKSRKAIYTLLLGHRSSLCWELEHHSNPIWTTGPCSHWLLPAIELQCDLEMETDSLRLKHSAPTSLFDKNLFRSFLAKSLLEPHNFCLPSTRGRLSCQHEFPVNKQEAIKTATRNHPVSGQWSNPFYQALLKTVLPWFNG